MALFDLILGTEILDPPTLPGLGFHFLEHAMVEFLANEDWTVPSTRARFEARIGRPLDADEQADLLSIFDDLTNLVRTPTQTTALFGLVVENEYTVQEARVRLGISGDFSNDFSNDFSRTR